MFRLRNIRDMTLLMSLLAKFPELTTLSLYRNQIRMLPICSKLTKLKNLNLSENPIKVDAHLLDSLYSIPKLQSLMIDGNEKDFQRITQNLPNLKYLNSKKVIRKQISKNNKEEAEKIKNLLLNEKKGMEDIKMTIYHKFDWPYVNDNKQWDEQFQQIIQECRKFTLNVNNDISKEGVFYYTKSRMLDILNERVLEIMQSLGMDQAAFITQQLNFLRKEQIQSIYKLILQIGYKQSYLEGEFDKEENQQLKDVRLRKQRFYLKEIMRMKKLVGQYRMQIKRLEEENQKLVENIYSRYRESADHIIKNLTENSYRKTQKLKQQKGLALSFNFQEDNKNKQNNTKQNQSVIKTETKQENKKEQVRKNLVKKQFQKSLIRNKSNLKIQTEIKAPLTIDQTVQLVQQIFKQKQSFNLKCLNKKQPFETAQQFMTIYFTRKYGLKSLAINSSMSFLKSLEVYSKNRTDFQVVLKIFKNKIQQSFYEQHRDFMNMINTDLEIRFIQKTNPLNIFSGYFPNNRLDYPLDIQQIKTQKQLKEFKYQLCKFHIYLHQTLLEQFVFLFDKYDFNGDGALDIKMAKQLTNQFLKNKVTEGLINEDVIKEMNKKLDGLKKKKVIFSELIDFIDNL